MEDAATSEISRPQVWQWIRRGAERENGRKVTAGVFKEAFQEVMEDMRNEVGEERIQKGGYELAGKLFSDMSTGAGEFAGDNPEFLTLPAYEYLVEEKK